MFMRSKNALLLLLVIVCVASCQKTSPSVNQTAAGNNASPQLQHALGGTTPQGQTKHFKGSIGSALDLQMKLVREGERLTGSYYYQKVGTKIDLRGSIDADGNLVLDEFDPGGKQTGSFKGTWKTEDNGLVTLAGNWSAPNSNKQTSFSLHEQPIEFSGNVEFVDKKITENNKKLKYEIDVVYPQLSGTGPAGIEKFNQLVRTLVNGKVADFKKEMVPESGEEAAADSESTTGSDFNIGYSVAMARDDLISLEFNVGSYYAGAAHPNSYSETFTFDLKNGKTIKLADLFNPGSKYVQAISAYAIQDLKKQSKAQGDNSMLDDDWIQRGAGPDAANYESWTITKSGLGITFDAYQVAPYAAGPQEVTVPYANLKEIIRIDGPLGQFLK